MQCIPKIQVRWPCIRLGITAHRILLSLVTFMRGLWAAVRKTWTWIRVTSLVIDHRHGCALECGGRGNPLADGNMQVAWAVHEFTNT
ncbi:hypothetical protein EDD37DRAFT_4263 [Exophiala viscosa]|uniref:Uncharacterized protein n=1 Tax=Exophiala viscosa TaxID=2486360 RepID=A0AAN6DL21_9EURO|nr:hypothetical protein EDD36DRAFT_114715 [Exophiala viscosa]KAI1628397.1 hypothetical protein EDD37DRAFT_4263 [Exophiala viscosa]